MSNQQYRHTNRKLSPSELVEMLTDQHSAMVDDPVMLWLSMSLEDMGDVITAAVKCMEDEISEVSTISYGEAPVADTPRPSGALAAVLKFKDGQDEFDNWRQS